MDNVNRIRIIDAARGMFNTRGYRSVTMKELADKLGMSKKTIYQYFSSKEDIAAAVVEESMKRLNEIIKITEMPNLDPQLLIKEILMKLKEESLRFGPLFMMDIEKYLPELASRYKLFKSENKQTINNLLKSAQHLDLVKDIPIPLVTEILSVCLKALVSSDSFSELGFSPNYALDVFLDIFGKGIDALQIREE